MRFVVITGPSGAGKTLALHSFEDAGYYSVDNVPPRLLPALIAFCRSEGLESGAFVVDTRAGKSFLELPAALETLRGGDSALEVLYLDATDNALIQRYKETRRPHPLRRVGPQGIPPLGIVEAIQAERGLLEGVRPLADHIFDTSALTPGELRDVLYATYAQDTRPGLLVTVVSFGFKYGLPLDADLVFDVRFLSNPHYVPDLKHLDGRNARVAEYVHNDPLTKPFQQKMEDLISFALPEYQREGKAYLTLAIGCTGGQHRSVVLAEELAQKLREDGYYVALQHRDADSNRKQYGPSGIQEDVSTVKGASE